ncbi:uncharacterized protein LOC113519420 [Galleria mellonella]|uniref:Uncharacterized protein LOC113519420 n=1 Tax=Galleria mellonella TaxID=7137 RepID=A0A6J1WVS4_GALME|nr:uncharacterized protein LOC113519420 [Galleria mellonella]
MVNYCCVFGCGRNSRHSKHLKYYSLPKERDRQIAWLKAAGREDLIEKSQNRVAYRICSRHFPPSSIKNKLLSPDAIPIKCLPGTKDEDVSEDAEFHQDIICNSCQNLILGFRYKCVSCVDYDLCPKCEMIETHPEHYMLRIPKPLKFSVADDLVKKWKQFFQSKHAVAESNKCSDSENDSDSSDNEPITKYVKHYDSGIDLSEDVKEKIRNEVTRVLSIKQDTEKKSKKSTKKRKDNITTRKRGGEDLTKMSKRQKSNDEHEIECEESKLNVAIPEMVFADVNEQMMDVKSETPLDTAMNDMNTDQQQPLMHVKLSDDFSELMIEMTSDNQKVIYKYSN